jgi:hypothetical protein
MSDKRNGIAQIPGTKLAVEYRMVTPEWAAALLEQNTKNRKLKKHLAQRFVRDMQSGSWRLTGEPIITGDDGTLLDGQHRLRACIDAQCGFPTLIVSGVPAESRADIDTGIARNMRDVLAMEGRDYPQHLAPAAAWLWRYMHGMFPDVAPSPTHEETTRILETCPNLISSVKFCASGLSRFGGTALHGFFHYLFQLASPDKANEFYWSLISGENLIDTSPIYVLRESLLSRHNSARRLRAAIVAVATVRAWNAFYGDYPLKSVRLPKNFDKADRFPEIYGIQESPRNILKKQGSQ